MLERTSYEANYAFSTFNRTEHGFENNLRFEFGLCSIGKGAYKLLCAIMNLSKPPRKFNNFNNILNDSMKDCAIKSMTNAVSEAVVENKDSKDITIALDGTWQKHGHNSFNGMISTSKVVDVEILTKHFQISANLKNNSEELQKT